MKQYSEVKTFFDKIECSHIYKEKNVSNRKVLVTYRELERNNKGRDIGISMCPGMRAFYLRGFRYFVLSGKTIPILR